VLEKTLRFISFVVVGLNAFGLYCVVRRGWDATRLVLGLRNSTRWLLENARRNMSDNLEETLEAATTTTAGYVLNALGTCRAEAGLNGG